MRLKTIAKISVWVSALVAAAQLYVHWIGVKTFLAAVAAAVMLATAAWLDWGGLPIVLVGLAGFTVVLWMLIGIRLLAQQPTLPQGYSQPAADGLHETIASRQAAIEALQPRKLSEEQARIIEEFLLKRPSHEMRVILDVLNTEANQYAAQLYNAFRLGGWKVSLEAAKPDEKLTEAYRSRLGGRPGTRQAKRRRTLSDAFLKKLA